MLQKACIKIVAHTIYTYLFFSYTYQGFRQVLRTWGVVSHPLEGGSSKFGGGRLKSIHGGAWGGLKCCQKYLWRSSFDSKVAGYKPANLAKMNFFTYIFQGFYLDFKLCAFSRNHFMERCFTFQWGVCLSDEGSFTFKWGGVHPMAGASVLRGGFQKKL